MTEKEKPSEFEFSVGIYAHGLDLDPESVSRKFGVRASEQWLKGETRYTRSNKPNVKKSGMWCHLLDRRSPDLNSLVLALIEPLLQAECQFSSIDGVETAELAAFGTLDTVPDASGTATFVLPIETIGKLSQLGVSFSVEIYAPVANHL